MNTEYASQKPEWVAYGISYGVSDAWECKALAAVLQRADGAREFM
jgi:hypothetical protein